MEGGGSLGLFPARVGFLMLSELGFLPYFSLQARFILLKCYFLDLLPCFSVDIPGQYWPPVLGSDEVLTSQLIFTTCWLNFGTTR